MRTSFSLYPIRRSQANSSKAPRVAGSRSSSTSASSCCPRRPGTNSMAYPCRRASSVYSHGTQNCSRLSCPPQRGAAQSPHQRPSCLGPYLAGHAVQVSRAAAPSIRARQCDVKVSAKGKHVKDLERCLFCPRGPAVDAQVHRASKTFGYQRAPRTATDSGRSSQQPSTKPGPAARRPWAQRHPPSPG